jgi:hypothetical protein
LIFLKKIAENGLSFPHSRAELSSLEDRWGRAYRVLCKPPAGGPEQNSQHHVCRGKQIMKSNTQHDRDPLAFSLRGTRSANSHAMVPVILDHGINRAWDARLGRRRPAAPCRNEPALTLQIEALLARYFAHGCCNAA